MTTNSRTRHTHPTPLPRTADAPAAPPAAPGPRAAALAARAASRALQAAPTATRVAVLHALADGLEARADEVLAANAADLAAAARDGTEAALVQRLKLTPAKLATLAAGVRAIAAQPEPLGRVLSRTEVADGLILDKTTAAIGETGFFGAGLNGGTGRAERSSAPIIFQQPTTHQKRKKKQQQQASSSSSSSPARTPSPKSRPWPSGRAMACC